MVPPLAEIASLFPPVRLGFAYGSGALTQTGYAQLKPMLDLLFVVDEPMRWHKRNVSVYPHHYAWFMRQQAVSQSQLFRSIHEAGAGLYFNTSVQLHDQTVKYGVVSTERWKRDMDRWSELYVAGRMQKPVVYFQQDVSLLPHVQRNLTAAVSCAILTTVGASGSTGTDLPLPQLLHAIAQLSYLGDVRQGIAENPRKVSNIVEGSYREFLQLYLPVLEQHPLIHSVSSTDDTCTITVDPLVWRSCVEQLPDTVLAQMEVQDTVAAVMRDPALLQRSIRQAIQRIVRRSSRVQTLKGILTAGVWTSVAYAAAKVRKRLS